MAALEIITAVGSIFGALKDGGSVKEKVVGANKALDELESKTALYKTNGSMTRFLSSYIIEPTAIVSKELANEEITEKLLELETDIFTSFYLQVFEILTKINNINAQQAIDLLSTDTTSLGSVLNSARRNIGHEDYDFTKALTLSFDMPKLSVEAKGPFSAPKTHTRQEAIDLAKRKYRDDVDRLENEYDAKSKRNANKQFEEWKKKHKDELKNASEKAARDRFEQFKKEHPAVYANKGTGVNDDTLNKNIPGMIQRNVNLEIITNVEGMKHVISIPVVIKLHIIYASIENILTMLEPNSDDYSFSSRMDEYRAGAISLAELVFASDLIKKYKHNKIKDKDNLLNLLNNRSMSAHAKGIYGKGVGFENYYNMLIITESDKILVEKHLKGKIKNDKYKEKLLEQSKSLTVTVVDRDYERVTILTKDIHGKSDVTYKAINKKSGKGDDMTDIFKALVANRNPVF